MEFVSYPDLYARWERDAWRATDIDFAADRAHWKTLSDIQRASLRWQLALFFAGEDAVADNLSPYIDAAPREEQKYLLATQQSDEVRHAVFFDRFFAEVIGTGSSTAARLAACDPELTWGYRKTFELLDRMADELRRDKSLPKLAQAITLYHVIVEGQLAQPGQHFLGDCTSRLGMLPGLREGIGLVARDERRHVAFGVKMLSELFAASTECQAAVGELLREVLRYTTCVFIPPGMDRRYTESLGFTLEEIFTFAIESFEARMRAAGLPVEQLPAGVYPFDLNRPPADRARISIALVEAGLTRDPSTKPSCGLDAQRLLFELVPRAAKVDALNGKPLTIQWRFTDAGPWHIHIANGAARATPGAAQAADVTLTSSWADWVSLAIGDGGVMKPLVQRKISIRGAPRQLLRFRKVFPL